MKSNRWFAHIVWVISVFLAVAPLSAAWLPAEAAAEPAPERQGASLADIKLPAGFTIGLFAGVPGACSIALSPWGPCSSARGGGQGVRSAGPQQPPAAGRSG